MEAIGMQVQVCTDDFMVLTMPVTDMVRQHFGILHGGVNMLLVESAASLHACWGIDLNEKIPMGIEINGSHLNAAQSGNVKTIAKVLRRSKKLIVHEVEITHMESGRVLCVGRMTNYYKFLKREPAEA